MNTHSLFTALNSYGALREARLVFQLPPPETGPPAPTPETRGEVLPPFNIDNPEAAVKEAIAKAGKEGVEAKTTQLNTAFNRFNLGFNRYKENCEKTIKAIVPPNPKRAEELRQEMNKTVDNQVALANANLRNQHFTNGYPLYQITRGPDGALTFTRQTGTEAAPDNLNKAISRLSPQMQAAIRSMPPDLGRMHAEALSGMSAKELVEMNPTALAFAARIRSMTPNSIQVAMLGAMNPSAVTGTPEQIAKRHRISTTEAQQVIEYTQALAKSDPRYQAFHARMVSSQERMRSSGAMGTVGANREPGAPNPNIPANGPVANADIQIREVPQGADPEQIKTNFRNALQLLIDRTSGERATEADRDMEYGKLQIMGADLAASQLDPDKGRLVLRTVPLRELQGAQLAGALTLLFAFLQKFSKDNPPLRPNSNPQNTQEREKRLKSVNERIAAIDKRLPEIDAELARTTTPPALPDAAARKTLTEEKTKITEERAKLVQERDKLQKEMKEGGASQARIQEIDKTVKTNQEQIKKLTDEQSRTPAPTPERAKQITEELSKLEKQNKELTAERQKLEKESGGTLPPATAGEGPRLPHSPENQKILFEESEKTTKALTNAIGSGANRQGIVDAYGSAITALENEMAYLQEYANPELVAPGRLAAITKQAAQLRETRTAINGPIWNKIEQDLTQARALPQTDNPAKVRRYDAMATALRAKLELLQTTYAPTNPNIPPVAAELATVLRERGAIEQRPPHTTANRENFAKATETASKALASAIGSGTNKPLILTSYTAAITAVDAELSHLLEYQVPPAAVPGEPPFNAEIRTKIASLSKQLTDLRLAKTGEGQVQLTTASDQAISRPEPATNPEKRTRLDAIITALRQELVYLQDNFPAGAPRTAYVQGRLAEARRNRAIVDGGGTPPPETGAGAPPTTLPGVPGATPETAAERLEMNQMVAEVRAVFVSKARNAGAVLPLRSVGYIEKDASNMTVFSVDMGTLRSDGGRVSNRVIETVRTLLPMGDGTPNGVRKVQRMTVADMRTFINDFKTRVQAA